MTHHHPKRRLPAVGKMPDGDLLQAYASYYAWCHDGFSLSTPDHHDHRRGGNVRAEIIRRMEANSQPKVSS